MATLNAERNQIVIRLVYDGLALSGKTTTLRMLASSLDQDFYTPEEHYGRTVFFDWVGYTGGLFEGYQIRCQIVSVPGQELWAGRRRRLLETADVVVFVGDTTRGRVADSLASLWSVHRQMQQRGKPAVGIILQANKRDLPDAMPLEEIHRELAGTMSDIAIVESVASEGSGVRQAFVFAVRLCLDRVRELIRTNTLPVGAPEVDSGEALLAEMNVLEDARASAAAASPPDSGPAVTEPGLSEPDRPGQFVTEALREVFESESHMATNESDGKESIPGSSPGIGVETTPGISPPEWASEQPPLLPQCDVPSGMIWPPVEGRITLSEAIGPSAKVLKLDNGDWTVSPADDWLFHSYKEDVFGDLTAARRALIDWAHRHITASTLISPSRCLVLAETGHGKWRLWQVIKIEDSLLLLSREALGATDLQLIADGIWGTVYMYLTAVDQFEAHRYKLPCTLDAIAFFDGNIRYNGLIPSPSLPWSEEDGDVGSEDGEELLRAHIREVVPKNIPTEGDQLKTVIDNISRRGDGSTRSRRALEITRELLAGAVVPR